MVAWLLLYVSMLAGPDSIGEFRLADFAVGAIYWQQERIMINHRGSHGVAVQHLRVGSNAVLISRSPGGAVSSAWHAPVAAAAHVCSLDAGWCALAAGCGGTFLD